MPFLLGVVILSAVLKRRMKLADKAKSLFISKYVNPSLNLLALVAHMSMNSPQHLS